MIDWSDYPNFTEAEMLDEFALRARVIVRMKGFMRPIAHNTKIFGAVVFFVAVDVMNHLVTAQNTARHFFYYHPMFINIPLPRGVGVIRYKHGPVAHSVNSRQSSTLPGTYAAARIARSLHMLGSEYDATDDTGPLVSLECSPSSALAFTDLRTAHFAYRNERNKVDFANWTSPLKTMLPAFKFSCGFCHV
jgi:hypothetical protein